MENQHKNTGTASNEESTEGLILVDTEGNNVIVTLPCGHVEPLTMVQAEGLAFALLDALKDEWE